MEIERCRNCGAQMDVSGAVNGVVTCEFCHSVFTVAKSKDETAINFIKIGEHDLDTCKFSDAYEAYNKAAQADNAEPEAYFGMALAAHKVQYIKDTVNNRLQPVCHEINDKTFTDDINYLKAIKYATNEQRNEYIRKGSEIDYIRKEFESIKNKGINYDCFICVKVTDDETKQRTSDYKIADDLYFHLRGKGYNPFFSEREIQNRTGADYEAMILYALYTSECMLIVCGNEAYLNTPWVKNEYTRFAAMIADEQKESDAITIVFDGKPIEKLPNRHGKIQGINIRDITATDKITKYVYEHTPEAKERKEQAEQQRKAEEERIKQQLAEQAELQAKQLEEFKRQQAEAQRELESKLAALRNTNAVTEPMQNTGGANTQSLLRRAEQFMSIGDFDSAKNYCSRVLDMDPENGDAWFMSFLAKYEVSSENELLDNCEISGDISNVKSDKSFLSAKKYAPEKAAAFERELDELHKRQEKIRQDFQIENGALVKYIGNDNNVVIPNSVTCILRGAFEGCNSLTSVIIPDSVTSVGGGVFNDCAKLESVVLGNQITDLPSYYKDYHDYGFFKDCISLTSIEIPNSVTSIGNSAFYGCGSLESIKIPNSVKSIGDFAFQRCGSLNNIEISNSVTSIGMGVFQRCSSLTSIEIPNSVTSIGNGAFLGCVNLMNIEIPNSVTSIGNGAFEGCSSLTSIKIPNSVTSIKDEAFENCDNIISATVPTIAIKSIPKSKLQTVIITGGKNIGDDAFHNCKTITDITIPNSVTSIGIGAFFCCKSLTNIEIPNSVTSIGSGAFWGCGGLTSVEIPNSVTSIGNETFRFCGSFTSIIIPDTVIEIGKNTFADCNNLQSITIPKRFKWQIGKIFGKSHKNAKVTFI